MSAVGFKLFSCLRRGSKVALAEHFLWTYSCQSEIENKLTSTSCTFYMCIYLQNCCMYQQKYILPIQPSKRAKETVINIELDKC